MGTCRRWILAGCVVLVLSPALCWVFRPRHEFPPVDVAAPASTLAHLGSPVPGTGPAREQVYRACELQGCATVVRTFDLTRPQNLRQVLASAAAWATAHGVVDRGPVSCDGVQIDGNGAPIGPCVTGWAISGVQQSVQLSITLAVPSSVVAPGYDDRGDAVGGDWTAYADEQVASVSTVISVSRGDPED